MGIVENLTPSENVPPVTWITGHLGETFSEVERTQKTGMRWDRGGYRFGIRKLQGVQVLEVMNARSLKCRWFRKAKQFKDLILSLGLYLCDLS